MNQENEQERCPKSRMLKATGDFASLANVLRDELAEGRVTERTVASYRAFESAVWELINFMHNKNLSETYDLDFYTMYFQLLLDVEKRQAEWRPFWRKDQEAEVSSTVQFGVHFETGLDNICTGLRLTIRYYLCSLFQVQVVSIKEQERILSKVAQLYDHLMANPQDLDRWKLINDLLGFSRNPPKLKPLEGSQHNPLLTRLKPVINDFLPFSYIASLYTPLRKNFSLLLRKAFTTVGQSYSEQIWENLERLLFPAAVINAGCIFNDNPFQKSRESMAFGIYLQQYVKMTEILTQMKEGSKWSINVVLELQKRKILSKILESTRQKASKIVARARNNMIPENRFRARQYSSVEEVIQGMVDIGVEREYAVIALQNVEVPDQNLALEWIDNNRALIEEMLLMRIIERTNQQKNVNKGNPDLIAEVSWQNFRKEVAGNALKTWIRFTYKELFQAGPDTNLLIKEILFLCMDYLDEASRNKQYTNLNDKIYKDIDDLNKQENVAPKLRLLISIMETLGDKLPKIRSVFYEKSINMKIVSFMGRVQKEDQTRLFTLINNYLPALTPETTTNEMEEYLAYLLDLTHQYKPTGKSIIHIFYKASRSGRQKLTGRIKRNIVDYLQLGLVSQSIVPILNIVLESDRTFGLVNAELDIKTYLYDRYKHRLNAFHPDKEHVLEIDIKEFTQSFSKYDKGSAIYEASKRLLAKKKNKNKYFYFDCRKPENSLGYSSIAGVNFISFHLKEYQKAIVRCLISLLFRSTAENIDQMLAQLHRILSYFRILLPYALQQKVDGKHLLQWLIDCPSHSRRKYKLLVFLLLNNNLFVKSGEDPYNFYSLADYACARVVAHLLHRDYQQGQYDSILACLYLQQVRRFSEFCATPFSKNRKETVTSLFEEIFQRATPLQYLPISEMLNVQYKRNLLNNLKRKYKIVGTQHEPTFERQFLNISAFYNSLPIRQPQTIQNNRNNPNPNPNLNHPNLNHPNNPNIFNPNSARQPIEDGPEVDLRPALMEEGSDSEQENYDSIGGIRQAMLQRSNYFYGLGGNARQEQEVNYEQLIAPLPQKPLKQGQVELVVELSPIVCMNNFTVLEILELFEQHLSFGMQVQEKAGFPNATPPDKVIKVAENMLFKVSLQESTVDLELKVRKNATFERHFGEIVQIFDPKGGWQDKRAAVGNFERRIQQISRRMLSGENREEMIMQLERLMLSRENREEEVQQQARLLNGQQIYNTVPEFTEPIVPVVPKNEPMVVEQKIEEKAVQPVVNHAELQVPIEPVVNSEVVQPSEIISEPIQVEEVQVIQEPMNIQAQVPVQAEQIQQVQQLPIIEANNQLLVEPIVQPIAEQPQQNQPPAQQAPVVPPPAVVPQVPQPPIRDRQILRIFGLPQTFLRDAGIDEESFDCLPEDFQQQQLMHFISQQNQALNRQNQANNNNANNAGNANNAENPTQPQVQDLQSDNVAFLASLDIHTRAQVLMQATPEFLSTLPANIREQAENYRHQQINRIIEEEDIEEERKIAERPKQSIVYPKVLKEEFSTINEAAAKRLFEGIFYVFPNFKLQAIKILLENKQNQGKTMATIIGILRYLDLKEENKLFSLKKVERGENSLNTTEYFQWSEQETQKVRVTLLHTIYEHLKIPFYKDEEFLSQALPIELYFDQLRFLFEEQDNIVPQLELFEFSLKYYPSLSTELIKNIKELPDRILVKIAQGIKVNSLPLDFYDHLQNFSQNERLKELFSSYFQQDRPKIEVLGKLLKYKFSHVPSLRKIHEQALENFSNTFYDFLNQIFSIYTVENLHQIEPMLVKHKHIHFEVIKYLLQNNKQIEKEPIGLLLKRPQLLDFETKKFIFRNHPRIRKLSRHRVHIEVDRTHLFQGSYNQLMSRSIRELEGRIQVSFVNEPGYDAGGLKREWFLVVSREIFNQDYALFEKSSSGSTYQPNPKSYINPDHLNYFKFIGRFIGKALVQRELIDAYFTRAFYKMILGQELEFKDLQAQDYQFYKSMDWLSNNPIDENMFTFSYIYDNFGNRIEKELVPGGKTIIVNEQNKKEYIEKYCLAKMRDDFTAQVNKFLEGFHEIVPQECISYFQAKELELLISGVPEVDVEDLKQNTDYSGYTPTDQIIMWFWEVVEEYSQEDLAKLVQFITGTSKIPVEGFSQLVGMNGIQRISIHRDPCVHQLPKSHTCFNQLDLPNYPTKEVLKQKLAICLAWGSEGFGFM